jgi:hypothetical protein
MVFLFEFMEDDNETFPRNCIFSACFRTLLSFKPRSLTGYIQVVPKKKKVKAGNAEDGE